MQHKLKFSRVSGAFAVCRLPAKSAVPDWGLRAEIFSVVSTADEVSVVCPQAQVPSGVKHEQGWTCLKIEGPFPFSQTGVLSSFLQPLAEQAISIFALSTFDTDYVLVKQESLEKALAALRAAGHEQI